MPQYLLGIDRGTTNIKAVVFDENGKQIKKTVRSSGPIIRNSPSWEEQDMNTIWNNTVYAIREIFDDTVRPKDIIAIGVAGQGNGLFMVDKHGNPLRNAILSVDTRSHEIVNEWNTSGAMKQVTRISNYPLFEANPYTLLKWLKKNEEESYSKIAHYFFSKDWIKNKLTGSICTDQSDAGGAGMLDTNGEYSQEILEILDLTESKKSSPAIVNTWEVCGYISKEAAAATLLVEGTPVVSGAHDIAACSWGAGGVSEGHLTAIVGTWGLNLLVLDKNKNNKNSGALVFPHAIPNKWLAASGDGNSGSSLEWFIGRFCEYEKEQAKGLGLNIYQLLERKASEGRAASMMFHPFIFGTQGFSTAKSGFLGMASWHNKNDIIRSVYEGITYSHCLHIANLNKITEIEKLAIVGGGASSSIWPQMFADVTGYCVEVPKIKEVAARGVALSAGVGVGLYKNHTEANKLVELETQKYPDNVEHGRYEKAFEIYSSSMNSMSSTWNSLYSLNH